MVIGCMDKESSQSLENVGAWPILHRFHFLGIHPNHVLTHNMASKVIVALVIREKYGKNVGSGFLIWDRPRYHRKETRNNGVLLRGEKILFMRL